MSNLENTPASNIENTILADSYRYLNTLEYDENLESYLHHTGPLTIAELPREVQQSEQFQSFVDSYGWPNNIEDSDIAPLPVFESDEQFREAFLHGTMIDGRLYNLNNFKCWISQEPNEDSGYHPNKMYGSRPALLRAYIVAPELMEAVRVAYMALPKRAHFPSVEAMESREAELVVKGAHSAYQLLGRLIKTTDEQTHIKMLYGASDEGQLVDDAASHLSQ